MSVVGCHGVLLQLRWFERVRVEFPCGAGMSLITSEAEFKARAMQLGLTEAQCKSMKDRGWGTYATFAFSSGYTPGALDDSQFLEHVVAPVLGDAQHAKAPILRFLVHEAYGLAAADLKSKIERVGDEAPKQLPMHERAVRVERLKDRMRGLELDGEFEPSYKLVDAAANMVELNRLRYLPWNECLSREQELLGVKTSREWRADSQGILREVQKSQEQAADVSTDYNIYLALHRRGVALDLGNVMRYEEHAVLAKWIMKELHRSAPEGYAKVSHQQAQQADNECWKMAATSLQYSKSLVAREDGTMPAAIALHEAMKDSQIGLLMRPLPALGKRREETSNASSSGQPPVKKQRPVPKKGSSKGQAQPVINLPEGLVGSSTTSDGSRICFAFNFKRCGDQSTKGCSRGRHVCTNAIDLSTVAAGGAGSTNEVTQGFPPGSHVTDRSRRPAAQVYSQPRGVAAVMPEYLGVVHLSCGSAPSLNSRLRTTIELQTVPKGSRLLSYDIGDGLAMKVGAESDAVTCSECGLKWSEKGNGKCRARVLHYGVYRSPRHFHEEALTRSFPMEKAWLAKPWQVTALKIMFSVSPSELCILRARALEWLMKVARELKDEEEKVHMSMPEHVRTIMKGKKVRLLELLLERAGYQTDYLSRGLREGFDLTGVVGKSGLFPERNVVEDGVTREQLLQRAATMVDRAVAEMRPGERSEEEELRKVTNKEVEKGWLKGPFTRADVDRHYGSGNW
eukprot:6492644-Amphidinium_carterae.2